MSSKINIWCPNCKKRYSVPLGMDEKSVKCKKCECRFKIADAIKIDPDAEIFVPEIIDAEPTSIPSADLAAMENVATPIHPPENSSDLFGSLNPSSQQPTPEIQNSGSSPYSANLSQYAANPPAGQPTASAPTTIQPGGAGRALHRSSAMMWPAVLGAIFFSLLMAGIAGAYTYYAVTRPAADKEVAQKPVDKEVPMNRGEGGQPETPIGDRPIRDAAPAVASDQSSQSLGPDVEDVGAMRQREEERQRREKAQRERDIEERKARSEKAAADRAERAKNRASELAEKKAEEKRLRLTPEDGEKETPNLVMRVQIRSWGATGLAVTDTGTLFVSDSTSVYLYDWNTKSELSDYNLYEADRDFGGPSALATTPDGALLAVGGDDGQIQIFEVMADGSLVTPPKKVAPIHEGEIMNMTISPDGRYLVAADRKKVPAIWNLETLECISKLEPFKKEVKALHISPTSQDFVRISDGESRRLVRLENGAIDESREFQNRYPQGVAFSPEGSNMVVSAGSDCYSFSVGKEEPISEFKGDGVQWNVAVLDFTRVLTCGRGAFYEWNYLTGEALRTFPVPDASYLKLIAISPDRSKAAVSSGSTRSDVFLIDISE